MTSGQVSDPAHHLSPATLRRIDSTIFALERATSDEIAVVVAARMVFDGAPRGVVQLHPVR